MIGCVKEDLAVAESGLLHLISLYAAAPTARLPAAKSPYICAAEVGKGRGLRYGAGLRSGSRGLWIRETSLHVILHEVRSVLFREQQCLMPWVLPDGDRALANISPGALRAIDALQKKGLLDCISMSAGTGMSSIRGFQVTSKGLALCNSSWDTMAQSIRDILYPPIPGKYAGGACDARCVPKNLLNVTFVSKSKSFILQNELGAEKISTILKNDGKVLLCAPFLPAHFRMNEQALLNFQVKITPHHHDNKTYLLDGVHAIVVEFVPRVSQSYVLQLSKHLDPFESCVFTSLDPQKRGSLVGVETSKIGGSNRVFNVDSTRLYSNHINLVVSANQNRCYSVNIHQSGFARYGMQIIESAGHEHQDNQLLPISDLASCLFEIHQDSSIFLEEILMPSQRSILDAIYQDKFTRQKYNAIFALDMRPFHILDPTKKDDNSYSMFRNLIGSVVAVVRLPRHHLFVEGESGCLFVGKCAGYANDAASFCGNSESAKQLVMAFVSIATLRMFVRNLYMNMKLLDISCEQTKELLTNQQPHNISWVLDIVCKISVQEGMLFNAFQEVESAIASISYPEQHDDDVLLIALHNALRFQHSRKNLFHHKADLLKSIRSAKHKIALLHRYFGRTQHSLALSVAKGIDLHVDRLKNSAKRVSSHGTFAIEVIEVVFIGKLAFEVLDRMSGGVFVGNVMKNSTEAALLNYTGTFMSRSNDWVEQLLGPILDVPLLWFFLNLIWLVVAVSAIKYLMRKKTRSQQVSGILYKKDLNENVSSLKVLEDLATHFSILNEHGNIMAEYFVNISVDNDRKQFKVSLLVDTILLKLRSIRAFWIRGGLRGDYVTEGTLLKLIMGKLERAIEWSELEENIELQRGWPIGILSRRQKKRMHQLY